MRSLSLLSFISLAWLPLALGLALPKIPTTSNALLSLRDPVHSDHELAFSTAPSAKPRSTASVPAKRQEDDFIPTKAPDEPHLPAAAHLSNHISRSDGDRETLSDNELHHPVAVDTEARATWETGDTQSRESSGRRSIKKRGVEVPTWVKIVGIIAGVIAGACILACTFGCLQRRKADKQRKAQGHGES